MSSARGRAYRLGLRARLTLWTTAVLVGALGIGFVWVHHGLRSILETKNDAFLTRKGSELSAVLRDARPEGAGALEAEIRREVEAYEAEGLVVVVRLPGSVEVYPPTGEARRVADRLTVAAPSRVPMTVRIAGGRHRVLRVNLGTSGGPADSMDLALSLSETEAILALFKRRAAAGGLVFLALAVSGGLLLSWQALRPVARSIATASKLNPADLTARLPRSNSGDELDRLAGTINDLLDRLADYHAQVTRFTADASHELRSPLSAMRAAVEVALQQPRTSAEYGDVLGSLGEQCERLTSLVNGLLLLASADAGQVDLRHEPVDLSALVAGVAEMYQPLAEERGVNLTWGVTPTVVVEGDPSRLRQLATNLVDNAIKFTESGGEVTFGVERSGDRARLVLSDTGIGIPADRLPHIFDRFYQADPARSVAGSGLGLSICRWIVLAHGGTIRAASVQGGGSSFIVELPLATRVGGTAGRTGG